MSNYKYSIPIAAIIIIIIIFIVEYVNKSPGRAHHDLV